jgi:60 kDa SS-A/Ro ribonucleoprotein
LTNQIADRLRDADAIARARVFPYQLMVAHAQAGADVPAAVREALHDAMEIATRNVPAVDGRVYVCPDVSGSMHSAVTGYRKGATTAVRCLDVAALVAACVLRTNRSAEVIPFSDDVVRCPPLSPRDTVMTNAAKLAALRCEDVAAQVAGPVQRTNRAAEVRPDSVDVVACPPLNPRDSVMTNARVLAGLPSGGTNCSAPLRLLNDRKATGDLVIFVSDNESWVDRVAGRGTATMEQWATFKARNPRAKLVCIDLQPYGTVQATGDGRDDVLNVGGFGDAVFEVVAEFAAGRLGGDHWVRVVEAERI